MRLQLTVASLKLVIILRLLSNVGLASECSAKPESIGLLRESSGLILIRLEAMTSPPLDSP